MSRSRAIYLLAFLVLGCDDDDEGRPIYRSGVEVEVSSPVAGLGNGELQQICQTLDVYVDTYVSFEAIAYIACLPGAIVLGGGPQGCERLLDQCMDGFPEPIQVQAELQNAEVCYTDLQSCQASVEELEGCINLNLDLAFEILESWTCSGAGSEDLRAEAARAMDTASVCADLDAACNRFATLGPD